jgi:Domain of unknown function (DUF4129)
MTIVLFAALTMAVAADQPGPLPSPEVVRNTARQVLARPEFQLDSSEAAESLWEFLHRLAFEVLGAFRAFFEWLYQMSPLLAWLFVAALVFTLLLLVGHILWTIVMVIRRDRRQTALADALSNQKVNPAELARQAEAARDRGEYILGVRLLFRACLALLEQREGRTFRPGATNREYLLRYRQTPLYDWLARFVWMIDSKWYGSAACLPADFAACREAYDRIRLLAPRKDDAQHA